MIVAGFIKEAVGQGSAQKLKATSAGRGIRKVMGKTMKMMHRSKRKPVRAMAHTLKDMSMKRAILTGLAAAPLAASPVPLAHPAGMMAMNAPLYRRKLKLLSK